jgi:hypothetical protein
VIGDAGGSIVWTYSHSSLFTHTDDERSTANLTFSVDIVRNLGSGSNASQRVVGRVINILMTNYANPALTQREIADDSLLGRRSHDRDYQYRYC